MRGEEVPGNLIDTGPFSSYVRSTSQFPASHQCTVVREFVGDSTSFLIKHANSALILGQAEGVITVYEVASLWIVILDAYLRKSRSARSERTNIL